MREYRKYFLRWFIVLFPVAYLVVRELQDSGDFDNFGIWYTIYCATGISLPIAALVAFFRDANDPRWWRLRR